jgi:ribose transport system permease protein
LLRSAFGIVSTPSNRKIVATSTEVPLQHPIPSVSDLSSRRLDPWRFLSRYGAILVLVGMIVTFAVLQPDTFLTRSNLIAVLDQSALVAIIAMGLTFPLVCGEFDLSIGYVASLSGIIAGILLQRHGWAIPAAIVAVVVVGALIGLINGLLVTEVGINALVATLGVGTIVLGVTYALTGGTPVTIAQDSFFQLSYGKLFTIPYPVWVMAAVAVLMWVVLNRTVFGQAMQAVGGNREAARLSGLRVNRIRTTAFVIAGMCAALAGILLASSSGSATVTAGDSYLLSAFAAAFFGSAVLREGQFHIVGTLLGVFTVAIGFNGIVLIGIGSYLQYLFQGALLIFAVGIGTLSRRRAASA